MPTIVGPIRGANGDVRLVVPEDSRLFGTKKDEAGFAQAACSRTSSRIVVVIEVRVWATVLAPRRALDQLVRAYRVPNGSSRRVPRSSRSRSRASEAALSARSIGATVLTADE